MNGPTALESPLLSRDVVGPGWRLEHRPHGRLDLVDAQGRRHADVELLRAFPLTAPGGPVAIVTAEGAELVWIDSLAATPSPLRELLEDELAAREFLPLIDRIDSVSDGDPSEWTVVTDRGPRRFTLAGPDDIERLPDGSAFIVDTAGVRYRIPKLATLDPQSRRLLDKTME
jgi:hypothetical protein